MTMPVATALSARHIVIEAGQERDTELVVRNDGQEMDQFTVSVLGNAARWTTVSPAAVTLMPGEEETLRVVYAPPRTAETRVGQTHVAFRIASHEDPRLSTTEESVVEVKPFSNIEVRLDPPKRTSMYRGRFTLLVENRGNTTVECQAVGYPIDDHDRIDVSLAYTDFVSEPGTSTEVKVQVVPEKRFMRGQPLTLPFAVEVSGDLLDRPAIAEGVLTQNPILNKNSVRLALAALALALLCGLGLFLASDSFGSENANDETSEGNASPDGVAPGIAVPPGQAGLDGRAGEAGIPGVAGAPGLPGAPGLEGPPGVGTPGTPGAAGAQGLPGEAGGQGTAGAPGAPGLPGLQGLQGNDGLPGAAGRDGLAGAPGRDGLQGIQGPAGSTGPTGERGPEGVPGPTGPGGGQGPAGPAGPTGPIGPTGPPNAAPLVFTPVTNPPQPSQHPITASPGAPQTYTLSLAPNDGGVYAISRVEMVNSLGFLAPVTITASDSATNPRLAVAPGVPGDYASNPIPLSRTASLSFTVSCNSSVPASACAGTITFSAIRTN